MKKLGIVFTLSFLLMISPVFALDTFFKEVVVRAWYSAPAVPPERKLMPEEEAACFHENLYTFSDWVGGALDSAKQRWRPVFGGFLLLGVAYGVRKSIPDICCRAIKGKATISDLFSLVRTLDTLDRGLSNLRGSSG